MGNANQGAASLSGEQPSCRPGDIIKALHPGLQCFCRARVIEVRQYKVPVGPGNLPPDSRWCVRVRWCEYWADEPDATCMIEPTIAVPATVPQNRFISFVQIVTNPFPYYPQFSEVYFQPEDAVGANADGIGGGADGAALTWHPGFIIEENEYQYHVMYENPGYRPHPILAMEAAELAEQEDTAEKKAQRAAAERLRVKTEYKATLIKERLHRDRKRREQLMRARRAAVAQARERLTVAEKAAESPEGGEADENEQDEHANRALELERAQKFLAEALAELDLQEDFDGEPEPEPEENDEDHDNQVSITRPSISKQPDTSMIYHINYPQLDPTFIYDPDLARLDDVGGVSDDDEAPDADMQRVVQLEMDMNMVDPPPPPHPSQWLDEFGEEKVQEKPKGGATGSGSTGSTTVKRRKKRRDSTGFGDGGDFYDPEHEAGTNESSEADDGDEDYEDDGEGGGHEDEDDDRPAGGAEIDEFGSPLQPLITEQYERSPEEQHAIDQWAVENPRFLYAWVNKYSTRLKRQTRFFNVLYAKYLQGSYEESMEDRIFKAQREIEELRALEAAKPKKWYKKKLNEEEATAKIMRKMEAQALREEEQLLILRDDTFREDDPGLEIARQSLFDRVVEQNEKWVIEDVLELDGDHLVDDTIESVKHRRRIHDRDEDDSWDSFMSDAWVRYRYEYRDPDHPDFHTEAPRGAKGGAGGGPKKSKWIWARVQAKDSNEMVLLLAVPDALRGLGNGKKAGGKRASTMGPMASSKVANQDMVILRRIDNAANVKLIKFYHDRERRWAMDSYRRYQLELAHRGQFLIFINRACVEASEDVHETEREMNMIISQHTAHTKALARAKNDKEAAAAAEVAAAQPVLVLTTKKNRRGSLIIGGNAARASVSSAPPLDPQAAAEAVLAGKEFSSNYLTATAGYGILGYDDMREDGNSLYRAVSLQLFGTTENYLFVKHACVSHIAAHPAYYAAFLDISFEYYLALKFRSMDPTSEVIACGDHLDLQALCEIYDVAVHIYSQIELGASTLAPGNAPTNFGAAASAAGGEGASVENIVLGGAAEDTLLSSQPFIRFYDSVLPGGAQLPTICLSYSGHGHYDAIKRRSTPWPLTTSLGFPVHTRTRLSNVVLRARQLTEFEAVEKVRVEEARAAWQLIAAATAVAPMGETSQQKAKRKLRRLAKARREAAIASGRPLPFEDSESEDDNVTIETIIAQMTTRVTRQVKPIDTQKMELGRTILPVRELVMSTYIGDVQFAGSADVQAATFLDCLASCKLEYGTKKGLLATGYHVHQAYTQRFWHDMQMQSMSELVSQQNLEGLAAVAMYGQADGSGGVTTMTGEGLKLNLPRVVVMYPYFPEDAHLSGDKLARHRMRMKGKRAPGLDRDPPLAPLMLIEGVQQAVEEMVRLVRRLAKTTKLRKISQATWLPPC